MSAHTPGPWVVASGLQVWTTYETEARHPLLVAELGRAPIFEDEQDANARLIAAAPDLLEALTEARRFLDYFANSRTYFEGGDDPKSALAVVEAAIAKATAR